MSVSYITPGHSPLATELNALTAELDAALRILYGEKTWLIFQNIDIASAGPPPAGKFFYFGDHTQWKIIPLIAGTPTSYNHATYTAIAAGLTVDSYDDPLELAYCTDGTPGDAWPLDESLEAHKTTVGPKTYFYAKWNGSGLITRERYRKLHVAEIVLEAVTSTLTWQAAWNKYHFLRFHNLDPAVRTVALPGGASLVLPPFGIRAIRRSYPAGSSWDSPYVYLWNAHSGDSLVFDGTAGSSSSFAGTVPGNNVASLRCFHEWLDNTYWTNINAAGPVRGIYLDPREVWDGSAILGQAIAGGTEIGKFEFHPGKLIIWQAASSPAPMPSSASPTWSELLAGTNGVKLTASTGSVPHVLTLAADTGATTPVDVSCPGASFLPVWPVTLPKPFAFGLTGIGEVDSWGFAPGGYGRIHGATADAPVGTHTYHVPLSADVDVSYTFPRVRHQSDERWKSPATASNWSTLNAHAAVVSSAGGSEASSAPTITWKSDGWRLVACGAVVWPLSLGYLPEFGALHKWYDHPFLTIGSGGFGVLFGGDVLGRSGWDITTRLFGRQTSGWVGTESGGTVTHDGHPDLAGTYGLAGGIDWTESRGAPPEPAILRTENIGGNRKDTKTLPVLEADDAGEAIVEGNVDPAWYVLARPGLLAQSTAVEDRKKVFRLPIMAVHYNHVAQRLKGICSIVPFTFYDVLYYGYYGLADTGAYWSSAMPQDFFCTVLATGSRAAALGLTVSTLDIDGAVGYYLKASDAAAYAASLGLRFFMRRLEGVIGHDVTHGYFKKADNTLPYRLLEFTPFGTPLHFIANHQQITGGGTADPFLGDNSGTINAMVELRSLVGTGPALPSGWAFATDAFLLTRPVESINFDDDPVDRTQYDANEAVFSLYGTVATDPAKWPIASLPQFFDSQAIAGLNGMGSIDGRHGWEIVLCNRYQVMRT